MTTELRRLLEDAEQQIDTYKSPDIDEFKDKMSAVLEAAGIGSLKHDRVESIRELSWNGHKYIEIGTSWSARGCSNTSDYRIDSSVIDSPDPIKAATIWGLEKKIADARNELSKHRGYVETYERKLAELTVQLENAQ